MTAQMSDETRTYEYEYPVFIVEKYENVLLFVSVLVTLTMSTNIYCVYVVNEWKYLKFLTQTCCLISYFVVQSALFSYASVKAQTMTACYTPIMT